MTNPELRAQSMREPASVAIHAYKPKLARWALFFCLASLVGVPGAIAFVVLTLYTQALSWPVTIMYVIIGVVLSIYSFPLALLSVRRLASRQPALALTPQGIVDNSSLLATGVGLVPWNELVTIYIFGPRKQRGFSTSLILDVHDPQGARRRLTRGSRILSLSWIGIPGPVHLPGILFRVPLQDLAIQICEYAITRLPADELPGWLAKGEYLPIPFIP